MKICPNCQQTYDDDGLNFCLNDGGILQSSGTESPTVMLNQVRTTSPNAGNDLTQPMSSWQTPPPSPMQPFQQQVPAYMAPVYSSGGDQTLAIISLVFGSSGILFSLCCLAGIPLGIAAVVTGFLGMNNATQNPQKYGGKNLAIGGLITGGIAFLISALYALLVFAR